MSGFAVPRAVMRIKRGKFPSVQGGQNGSPHACFYGAATPRHAALKAPPSRRAEGATTARRLGRHTVLRLGCHRYAVLKALPRRSSPLPRLLAQAFGGHQRRAARRHVRRTNGKERLLRSMYNIVATTDRRASKRAALKLVGLWCSRNIISLHWTAQRCVLPIPFPIDLLLWQ